MPKAYFAPETLCELAEVFRQAKAILERRGETAPETMDFIAHRILTLAADGLKPGEILAEVLCFRCQALDADKFEASAIKIVMADPAGSKANC